MVPVMDARKPNSSDASEPLYVSHPVTERGVFSHEIDGPAVDPENHLFVANIGHKGTIARQRPGETPELWWTLPDDGVSAAIEIHLAEAVHSDLLLRHG